VSGSTSLMSSCTVEVVLVEVWNISCCCSVVVSASSFLA
jgi:hypothetical protein